MKRISSLLLAISLLACLPTAATAAPEGNIIVNPGATTDQYGNLTTYNIPNGETLTVLNFTQEFKGTGSSFLTVQQVNSSGTPTGPTVAALAAGILFGQTDSAQFPAPQLVIPGPAVLKVIAPAASQAATNLLFSAAPSGAVFTVFTGGAPATPFTVPAGFRLQIVNFVATAPTATTQSPGIFAQQLTGAGTPLGPLNFVSVATFSNFSAASQISRTPAAGGQSTIVGPATVTVAGIAGVEAYAVFQFVPNR